MRHRAVLARRVRAAPRGRSHRGTGPSGGDGELDVWPLEPDRPLEPDDDVITQAYFDAKCAGDDGDWADLTYDNLYY